MKTITIKKEGGPVTYDLLIVGGGPAGLSAGVAARGRGKTALVLSNRPEENPLWRAEKIDNYPGLPGLSGKELLTALGDHARTAGAELRRGRVLSIMALDGVFYATAGNDIYTGKKLILATGVARGAKYPGEAEYLGRGVSYCATCDGMLYRGKPVAVTGRSADAPHEANYLKTIGCQVAFVGPGARPPELAADIPFLKGGGLAVEGDDAVTGLRVNGSLLPCQGVFILRPTVAPGDMLPGLALEGGYIRVDRQMTTNLAGVWAAGDCTGGPLQAVKAAGEGLVAAQSAAAELERQGA